MVRKVLPESTKVVMSGVDNDVFEIFYPFFYIISLNRHYFKTNVLHEGHMQKA